MLKSSKCHIFQVIDEEVLCVHGGLSPDIRTIDQVLFHSEFIDCYYAYVQYVMSLHILLAICSKLLADENKILPLINKTGLTLLCILMMIIHLVTVGQRSTYTD